MDEYDVFISFANEDRAKAAEIRETLTRFGLRAYSFLEENRTGDNWQEKVVAALRASEYLIVVASAHAANSEEVRREFRKFSELSVGSARQTFVFEAGRDPSRTFAGPGIIVARDVPTLAQDIIGHYMTKQRPRIEHRLNEAFKQYRQGRFWRPLTENKNVHIFTCARDTGRGSHPSVRGGRSNIDKWDYTSVVDITHFLSRHDPTTRVTIADPVSKLSHQAVTGHVGARRIAELIHKLRNKDCVIIGSPDVSDFAEIVLAQTHGIDPYCAGTKKRGFVLLKRKVSEDVLTSSHYRTCSDDHPGGVAKLADGGSVTATGYSAVRRARDGDMYGVLAVVANPFCDVGQQRRIVLLSGLSGIATNAMAKFLTDDNYLDQFAQFDRDYFDVRRDIEAVIGVRFDVVNDSDDGDWRRIGTRSNDIWYEDLVDLE